ncbi:Phospholipase_D-nuclease N-terminal [Bizionia paragorgiae]|uniref:Phospholipase_D-nuclease N-terminal n=2 Tax=Bizionia paragorgiae TaxID=283786 RepID=A0A1H3YX81_BIZPA|nr:Phospholipase_D-nuclease N-terminal [Bizionia paragorgiae]
MTVVNPLTLLLMFAFLFGYIALSIWFILNNEQNTTNRTCWICIILALPFIGSTFCFLKYFIDSDFKELTTNKTN